MPTQNQRARSNGNGSGKIDPSLLKRSRPAVHEEEEEEQPPPDISQGAIGRVIDLTFNPTREKIREVTVVDRLQARWFPQLDMINALRKYCLEIAYYRENKDNYRKIFKRVAPKSPDALDEYLYRTAQWQKSVGGKNMDRAIDIALAETERGSDEDEFGGGGGDVWKE